jgi:hypothetical protein
MNNTNSSATAVEPSDITHYDPTFEDYGKYLQVREISRQKYDKYLKNPSAYPDGIVDGKPIYIPGMPRQEGIKCWSCDQEWTIVSSYVSKTSTGKKIQGGIYFYIFTILL